ncbi:MAG: undecaprenyldiphospho-muramoylpentapeptide beta-N-acetylglucosaminyltransferase [Deltaproteobacteria bacterium]|nr:undecaprenyldiphospho-muramoylpentapeptide beta-N-acetylglucosaminyltransferase [Deltaproteobacteria bacterium]
MGIKAAPLRLVFAGGGTGGHLFPAIALADEFRERFPDARIVFAGGRGRMEEKVVPACGYEIRLLDVEGAKNRGVMKGLAAAMKAARATASAVGMLREIRPQGVIGSGSYSSAPVVAAARLLGIKTAILEQNALPGLTNRLLGRFVDRVYIAFDAGRAHFPAGRTLLTGTPVRKSVIANGRRGAGKGDKFSILVFGGSQGATAINTAFLDAAEYLTDIWGGLSVTHQSGREGYDAVAASYARKGLKADVYRFIDDMGAAYGASGLVICRAGATSIAEMTAIGLPAILIPYPYAADDHQTVNAGCLAEAGAAVVIPQDKLTGKTLADAVRRLYERPGELKAMRARAYALGRPEAAGAIAENFLRVIKKP